MTKEVWPRLFLAVPRAKKAFFQLWLTKDGAVRGMSRRGERSVTSRSATTPGTSGPSVTSLSVAAAGPWTAGDIWSALPARWRARLQPAAPHLLPARRTAWFAQFPGSRRETAVFRARRLLLPPSGPGGPWPTTPQCRVSPGRTPPVPQVQPRGNARVSRTKQLPNS